MDVYLGVLRRFFLNEIPFNIHHHGPISVESHKLTEHFVFMLDNFFIPFDSQPGIYYIDENYYQKPYVILRSTSHKITYLCYCLYEKLHKNYIKIKSVESASQPIDLVEIYFTVENDKWHYPLFDDIREAIQLGLTEGYYL